MHISMTKDQHTVTRKKIGKEKNWVIIPLNKMLLNLVGK